MGMTIRRAGFIHVSNKMRTKWEDGVRKNREKLIGLISVFKTWEAKDGWAIDPEYMHRLEHEIKKQEQYLRNRFGETT